MRVLLLLFAVSCSLAQQSVLSDYTRSWHLVGQRRPDEAVPVLQNIIAREPSFQRAYDLLVEAYKQKKDFAGAQRYLESVLRNKTTGDFALYGLGKMWLGQRRPDEAKKYYLQCIRALPRWHACYSLSDSVHGRDDSARASIQQVIASDPRNPAAHFGLGEYMLVGLYQPSQALPEYDRTLELLRVGPVTDRELELSRDWVWRELMGICGMNGACRRSWVKPCS